MSGDDNLQTKYRYAEKYFRRLIYVIFSVNLLSFLSYSEQRKVNHRALLDPTVLSQSLSVTTAALAPGHRRHPALTPVDASRRTGWWTTCRAPRVSSWWILRTSSWTAATGSARPARAARRCSSTTTCGWCSTTTPRTSETRGRPCRRRSCGG